MDTIKTTVTEDALGKDVKHPASSGTCEKNSVEKPDEETSFNTEKEAKANRDESDELLKKIEEVVKDKINSEIMDNDISQSSEHEFIKKIEEIENEVEEAKDERLPSKKQEKEEYDSDQIIVGKLVMEVSSDGKNEKVERNDANGEGSNDLVSSVSENVCKDVSLLEGNKGVEADSEKIVDSTSENVGEKIKSSEISTCSETKENSKKTDAAADAGKSENVLSVKDVKCPKEKVSDNESSEVPDTTTDKEAIPSKSEESAVKTSEKSKCEIFADKSSTESCSEVSEGAESNIKPLKDIAESPKTSTDVLSIAKPVELVTQTKQVKDSVEEPKPSVKEVCKETAPESGNKDEPMVIDLCDPSDEPMDVDCEEKMDIDAVSDDICEVDDEEMKSAEEIVQNEKKSNEVTQDDKIKSPKIAETSKLGENKQMPESKVADPTTSQPKPDSQITGKLNKKEETKESGKSEKTDQLKEVSEANKKLPKMKSPIASENATSKTKISTAATSRHDKEDETSHPPQKETIKAEAKKAAGDLASTKGNVEEKKIKPEKEVPGKKSDSCLKPKSTPEKKDGAGDCPTKSTIAVKISESVEADSTEGKDNSDKKESGKKEVESVKIQDKGKESKDVKVDEDKEKKTKKSKKEHETIQKEKVGVQIEEAHDQPKSTSESVQAENKIAPEIKEHHSSDSTASLSSNADEHIIKFGMETTLPGTELEPEQPAKKIENKPLMNIMKHGCSTPTLNTTPVAAPNVFNSTPIQKQFEISSENVSKISETNETSRTEKTVEEDANLNKSSKPEYSSESGTTYTCK